MIQTSEVIERLHLQWPDLEIAIERIRTHGDRITDVPLTQIGGDGVFVTEIERALSEKRIDLAVHSLKDLPTTQPNNLRLVIIGPREDVRDVLIWKDRVWHSQREPLIFSGMKEHDQKCSGTSCGCQESADLEYLSNPRIGTCSLRRTAQMLALYPNAQILPLRGNVDTRLRKLDAGEYDAIVLAAAGLHRLGVPEHLHNRITYLPIDSMMPAPGQGALALEIRDDPAMRALIEPLSDTRVQATTTAERAFMRRLGVGCYLPIAAHGQITNGILALQGLVISLDGQHQVRVCQSVPWTPKTALQQAEQLGIQLAEQALIEGAAEIINALNIDRTQERQHV
jgi:hydroxymethylbilane synthase